MTHTLTFHPDLIAAVTSIIVRHAVPSNPVDVDGYRFKIDSVGTLLVRNLNADRPTVYRRVVTA